ncbi:MAG: TolC family protein [Paludibacter sp.]
MKKLILNSLLLFLSIGIFAQNLTIETCQEKAKANYPLVKQYGLIEQTARYNIDNANRGYLPQLTLSAKATYQSDVTTIPAFLAPKNPLTGVAYPITSMPKDQYQAVLEASQLIWDGGLITAQNKITKAGTEVEKQKLEVDLYALKDRVNQLFFGMLLLDEQLKQTDILKNDLQTNFNRVASLVSNGVASQPDLDVLKVELINVNQRISDINNTRKTYGIMLSALCGVEITDKTELQKPETDLSVLNETANHRPELSLFDAQAKLYENQKSLVTAANLPKVGAFVQGGYGLPALNMFDPSFAGFYIAGLRLSWNISGFYTQKDNLCKLEVSKKTVGIQRETFLFNSNLLTKQQQNEVEKIQSSLKSDDEIIGLRQNIKKSTQSKQINGTSSVSDLIRDVNAENQARQLKSLHEIQLLMNVYQLKNNINN